MPDKDVIRLTNRTARALRESARRQRLLFRIAAVVLTIVLAAVSVLLGLRWLFAVPAGVLTAVLLDALLLFAGQARYLSLTGQAICTEAAARQIRGEADASSRRRQALRDLAAVSADAADALRTGGEMEDDDLSAQSGEPLPAWDDADDPDLRPEREPRAPRTEAARGQRGLPDTFARTGEEPRQAAPARRRRQAAFQVLSNDQQAK